MQSSQPPIIARRIVQPRSGTEAYQAILRTTRRGTECFVFADNTVGMRGARVYTRTKS